MLLQESYLFKEEEMYKLKTQESQKKKEVKRGLSFNL